MNEIPFKDNIVRSNIAKNHCRKRNFFEFEHNSDQIIRTESFNDLKKRYGEEANPIITVELGNRLYKELEDVYGIIVPVKYVVSKDREGQEVVYGVTDKIEGESLDRVKITPELVKKMKELCEKIALYYLSKTSDGGRYLADIANASQYVYGTKRGNDGELDIYLIDTDLYMREGIVALYNIVLWFSRHMISMERRCRERFDGARSIIEKILNKPFPENLPQEKLSNISAIIRKIRGYLDNTIAMDDKDAHPIFSDF